MYYWCPNWRIHWQDGWIFCGCIRCQGAEVGGKRSCFLSSLFASDFKAGPSGFRLGKALAEQVVAGGFPAALARANARRRATWYRDYADTLIQRDIRDLARINALDALPRLLVMAAGANGAFGECLRNVGPVSNQSSDDS